MEQEILPPKPKLTRSESKRGGKRREIDYERVKQLAARGLNQSHISMCLGFHRGAVSIRKKQDEKLQQAMAEGLALGIAHVTARLLRAIDTGDVRAMMFFLERKAGWVKHSVTEHHHSVKVPAESCTMEEAEAAYADSVRLIEHQP